MRELATTEGVGPLERGEGADRVEGGDLNATVRAAARVATRECETQWVGLRVEIPLRDSLAIFEALEPRARFYWERPAEGRAVIGQGCVAMLETAGPGRFAESSARAIRLFEALHLAGEPAPPEAGPFLVGGFAFSDASSVAQHWADFPGGSLVLPEVTIALLDGRAWCTVLRPLRPGADPSEVSAGLRGDLERLEQRLARPNAANAATTGTTGEEAVSRRASPSGVNAAPAYQAVADRSHADYCNQVRAALRAISEGVLEKVVLARSVCLRREGGFELAALLDTLRQTHPSCAIFALERGSSILLGATPECLARLRGRRLDTASVAGSAPRGRSPEEDSRLGFDLLESKKEQAEHAVVVRALREGLAPHCAELVIPESPGLMRLHGIQHLETPITGTVREGVSILDLLGALHPTPAIAGEPREAALAWLAEHEHLDRGWYGGPVGFSDAAGGGEFFAALRSSLVTGDEARLFAGAGIVEGSQPEHELSETRLKLRTMLGPLFEI